METDLFRKLCYGAKFSHKSSSDAHPEPRKVSVKADHKDDPVASEGVTSETVPEAAEASRRKKKRKKKKKSGPSDVEIKRQKLRENRIFVDDESAPLMTEFQELGLDDRLLQNVMEAGWTTPTPVQMQAIPLMMERRNMMVCAPTGSGKTAAFVIPLLHHLQQPGDQGIRAVILAPTRELAKQTVRVCERLSEGLGFKCRYIENADKAAKLGPGSQKNLAVSDVLVSTPNRLVFMLQSEPPLVDLSRVQWLVVDESDKLFEDGQSGFRSQLAVIYNACCAGDVRRALFSATFAQDVKLFCQETMEGLVQVNVGARNSATHLVKQELLFVGSEYGKLWAMEDLIRKGFEPPVLIFVQSIQRAKELFSELVSKDIPVDVIHAERSQQQRDDTVAAFTAGRVWVLVCTEVLGRGVDFQDVNLVINYDFPTTAISYIHRIGRTGRAGKAGRAITFFTEDDAAQLRSIANIMKESGCEVPDYMLQLKKPSKNEKKRKFPVKRKRISFNVPNKNSRKRKGPDAAEEGAESKPGGDDQRVPKKQKKGANRGSEGGDATFPKKPKEGSKRKLGAGDQTSVAEKRKKGSKRKLEQVDATAFPKKRKEGSKKKLEGGDQTSVPKKRKKESDKGKAGKLKNKAKHKARGAA